jgi:type IV secretory pathway VirB10-like protein
MGNLKPGVILYAVTDVHVDSDLPSPVVATVISGELKGAKAIGSFKRNGDKLAMSFSKLLLSDLTEIQVEAYGVDPSTRKGALNAKVDTHFLERWGSLIASSFLEGFGNSMSKRGMRVYHVGDTVVEESLGKDMESSAYEAVGKVGERAATQVEKGFDRAPTVEIQRGANIGILIIDRK